MADVKPEVPQAVAAAAPLMVPPSVPLNSAVPMISTPAPGQTAEPQLQYLASLQGFKVQFTDFPKDGGNILR